MDSEKKNLTGLEGFDFSNPVVKECDARGYGAEGVTAVAAIMEIADANREDVLRVISSHGFSGIFSKAFRQFPIVFDFPVVELEPKALLFAMVLIPSVSVGKYMTLRRDCIKRKLLQVSLKDLIEMYPYGFYTAEAIIARYKPKTPTLFGGTECGDTDTARMLRVAACEVVEAEMLQAAVSKVEAEVKKSVAIFSKSL